MFFRFTNSVLIATDSVLIVCSGSSSGRDASRSEIEITQRRCVMYLPRWCACGARIGIASDTIGATYDMIASATMFALPEA